MWTECEVILLQIKLYSLTSPRLYFRGTVSMHCCMNEVLNVWLRMSPDQRAVYVNSAYCVQHSGQNNLRVQLALLSCTRYAFVAGRISHDFMVFTRVPV